MYASHQIVFVSNFCNVAHKLRRDLRQLRLDLFGSSLATVEQRVPSNHPIRLIKSWRPVYRALSPKSLRCSQKQGPRVRRKFDR